MATDATGTPSANRSYPKYLTSADAPSGVGLNNIIDAIDADVQSIVDDAVSVNGTPTEGDALVWDATSSTWKPATDQPMAVSGLAAGSDGQVLTTNGSAVEWASGAGLPPGSITLYAASSAPSGWLVADGTAVSRSTYADLFTAISTSYGAGDGSTTFNLPDLRGRVPVGLGTHADVNALGDNDGSALANRRPKHATAVFTTPNTGGGIARAIYNITNMQQPEVRYIPADSASLSGASNGVESSTSDPVSTPAYVVVQFIIKT